MVEKQIYIRLSQTEQYKNKNWETDISQKTWMELNVGINLV